jgi:hypothetical protein
MTLNEFQNKYSNLKTNFLYYEGIIKAIRQFQQKQKIVQEADFKIQTQNVFRIINGGNKAVLSCMVQTDLPPAGVQKWNFFYANLNWVQIFGACQKTTNDSKLKWFQLRLIYRILPTNRYLFLMKLVDSPLCAFCQNDEETIVHLFWQCRFVDTFWRELEQCLTDKCAHLVNFHFDLKLILFGVHNTIYTDNVIDLLIILAKYFVYKCKWTSTIQQ